MYGMSWKEFLTDQERERLVAIKAEGRALKDEHRRIYDRCRKRMKAQSPQSPGAFPDPGASVSQDIEG